MPLSKLVTDQQLEEETLNRMLRAAYHRHLEHSKLWVKLR